MRDKDIKAEENGRGEEQREWEGESETVEIE